MVPLVGRQRLRLGLFYFRIYTSPCRAKDGRHIIPLADGLVDKAVDEAHKNGFVVLNQPGLMRALFFRYWVCTETDIYVCRKIERMCCVRLDVSDRW